jgi:hypothetical protein
MCNEAEPSAMSELTDFATCTLENFCGDLTEKAQKDGSRIELSPALIELMGMALYWIWVFDHFIDLEDIVKSVQSKAEAWIEADPDRTTRTAGDAQKSNSPLGRLH